MLGPHDETNVHTRVAAEACASRWHDSFVRHQESMYIMREDSGAGNSGEDNPSARVLHTDSYAKVGCERTVTQEQWY